MNSTMGPSIECLSLYINNWNKKKPHMTLNRTRFATRFGQGAAQLWKIRVPCRWAFNQSAWFHVYDHRSVQPRRQPQCLCILEDRGRNSMGSGPLSLVRWHWFHQGLIQPLRWINFNSLGYIFSPVSFSCLWAWDHLLGYKYPNADEGTGSTMVLPTQTTL